MSIAAQRTAKVEAEEEEEEEEEEQRGSILSRSMHPPCAAPFISRERPLRAFLIPYFLCVLVGGVPMFFLEVAIGQFMSEGGIAVWNICPLLQGITLSPRAMKLSIDSVTGHSEDSQSAPAGIGFATVIIVGLLNIYYNVILAWAFHYLFASLASVTSVLPWATCDNDWNTQDCVRSIRDGNTTNSTTFTNGTSNATTDPTTEYWERKVLHLSSGVDDVGQIRWDLALCLLLAWIVVYFCIWKGIKSSGKVMYFTATSPYLLMFALLIRGVTLPGSVEGIRFYLIPDWEKLQDAQVWVDAGTQIFFSYSISLGTLIALGSYNKWDHNCFRDCVIFAGLNSGTSFLSGFVIFSVLGFMAHEQGVSVADVAESGPGLAFIAYPKAVAQMPFAPAWSILFFIMIILLGLDSQFVGVEGFITAIVDVFPRQMRRGYRREVFIAVVCLCSFFVGLPMVTEGGIYVFLLFDYYAGSRIILLVAFFECFAVAYIYGATRFHDNLTMMLGYKVFPIVKFAWWIITPLFTLGMFALCIYSYSELTYNRDYIYPRWAIAIGWTLACSSVFMIPFTALFKILREDGTLAERIRKLIRPRLKQHQLRPEDDIRDLFKDNTNDLQSAQEFKVIPSDMDEYQRGLLLKEQKVNGVDI
ncbi:hypothetical protein CAPTEDRAFT_221230 [Capitella teleta]|uniref:Transporter n=1 Tax=Capitella teleta TaxID=283909 RepID=R7TKX3_CAPTE|nr:hypothetical protein CAPTEDRAFT_221230 [Capitella teleta]|eukprot:ELT92206.1 hypothetical protein CAPTEDRAFT_221230 [Capitella teleta]